MQNGFPQNSDEALAMLYLQNQDLSDTTPERLAEWYEEVKSAIAKARKNLPHPTPRIG